MVLDLDGSMLPRVRVDQSRAKHRANMAGIQDQYRPSRPVTLSLQGVADDANSLVEAPTGLDLPGLREFPPELLVDGNRDYLNRDSLAADLQKVVFSAVVPRAFQNSHAFTSGAHRLNREL